MTCEFLQMEWGSSLDFCMGIHLTLLTLPQPTITPSPPPASQPSLAGNHSPHLPAQQTPAAAPEQSRKAGQNFKCLWQSCKRYVSETDGLLLVHNSVAFSSRRGASADLFFISSLGGLKRRLRCFTTQQRNTVEKACMEAIVSGRDVNLFPGRDCPLSRTYR